MREYVTLKMEAASSFEKSVLTHQTTWCHMPVIFISNKIFSVHLKLGKNQLHAENQVQTQTLLDPIIRGNVYEEQPSATSPSFVNGVRK
jgi:hypothetical protein